MQLLNLFKKKWTHFFPGCVSGFMTETFLFPPQTDVTFFFKIKLKTVHRTPLKSNKGLAIDAKKVVR